MTTLRFVHGFAFGVASALLIFLHGVSAAQATPLALGAANLVISQVYGGGGCTTSCAYKNDYIVLFNRGRATVALAG